MKKKLQNKELQEYLKRFADNAAVSMIVADIKKQKKICRKIWSNHRHGSTSICLRD